MSQANNALIDAFREDFAIAARGGLEDFLHAVEGEARRLAPVRKVFKAGGRRQLTWRNVFSTSSRSSIAVMREYNKAFGSQRTNRLNVQGLRIVEKGGRRVVQVQTYQQQEPYSSPARRSWMKVNTQTYQMRQGSLLNASGARRAEPLLFVGGARRGQAYAFENFDRLNYEGRRALGRGLQAVEERGFEYVDAHKGGMVTVAGKETKSESPHVEAIPQVQPGRERFGQHFNLQLGGALRKSIEMEPPAISGTRVSGSVGTDLRYALYVEFGTAAHGAAQPYLRPALMRYRYLLARSVGSNVRHRTI
jgi:hypothetical protein